MWSLRAPALESDGFESWLLPVSGVTSDKSLTLTDLPTPHLTYRNNRVNYYKTSDGFSCGMHSLGPKVK